MTQSVEKRIRPDLTPRIALRAAELFADEREALARRTDRLFAVIMVLQWLAGLAVALWISPLTWAGVDSQVHLHVYMAVIVGGILTALPVLLAILRPGRAFTRYCIAVSQMLTSALLIHLTGGRIETHFHVFGSLAILAFYRDWKVLVTASVVVVLDHLVRGVLWPQSVYGVLEAAPWRALEHAGWVAFVDCFLILSIRRSLEATRDMAEGQAQAEATHEVDSLLTLLNDILDFSKIEAGKLELERIPFGLRECVGSALKSMALRAHQKGLELACHVAPETPDRLIGDPSRLRQVLLNLVGNAIKFTEAGEILVQVDSVEENEERSTVRFTVQDTGVGIPEEKQRLIFDSFTQADGSTTRRHGGTGLGLTICRQLVELMGGEVSVRSRPDQGSTFAFSAMFPIQAAAAPPMALASLRDRRVLVVDGNATSRSIFTTLLHRWKALPLAVENGESALVTLQRARGAGVPFELVLLAAHMPGTDGIRVAEQIKQNLGLDVPILLLTSAGRSGDAARSREIGIAGYLTKPVMAAELLEAIRAVFGEASGGPSQALITQHSLREDRHRLRLLLAEDNPVNRLMIARILEKRGHYVHAVEDGSQVLTALETDSYDVILMDVQMPKLDGFETTAAIRQRERETGLHVPILALTAHALKGDRERCLDHGMDGYVTKPIQVRELLAAIEELAPHASRPDFEDHAPDGPPQILDLRSALRYADGDKTMLAEFTRLYLADAPRQLEALEAALEAGEARNLERAAHGLKGALGQIGARAAAEVAQRLETLAANGDLESSARVYASLRLELRRLAPALESLLEAA